MGPAATIGALALIANFDMTIREAVVLLTTFLLQLAFPGTEVRLFFAALYVLTGCALLAGSRDRRRTLLQLPAMVREAIGLAPPARRVESLQ